MSVTSRIARLEQSIGPKPRYVLVDGTLGYGRDRLPIVRRPERAGGASLWLKVPAPPEDDPGHDPLLRLTAEQRAEIRPTDNVIVLGYAEHWRHPPGASEFP